MQIALTVLESFDLFLLDVFGMFQSNASFIILFCKPSQKKKGNLMSSHLAVSLWNSGLSLG